VSNNRFYLEDFNYDDEAKKIIACPQGNLCIESEYIPSKKYYYARFKAEQCHSCNFIKQCPVKIKNKYSIARIFKKPELKKPQSKKAKKEKKPIIEIEDDKVYFDDLSDIGLYMYTDEKLERILRAQVEMEIGTSIAYTRKKRGKKYEHGVISYDGEYLDVDNFLNNLWVSHGYGKSYYEDGSLEYEGNFIYGHPHGYGKYYYRNGQVKWEGIFEAIPNFGKVDVYALSTAEGYVDRKGRIKYGRKYNESGKLEYEGEFKLGIPDGQGKLYGDFQELIFVGEFKNGKPVDGNKLEEYGQEVSTILYEGSNKSELVGNDECSCENDEKFRECYDADIAANGTTDKTTNKTSNVTFNVTPNITPDVTSNITSSVKDEFPNLWYRLGICMALIQAVLKGDESVKN